MFEHMFASPGTLALGALTGLVFGFLLQRGGVARYNVIVSQFLFRDFTVLKVMLTAIVVGSVGVWGMLQAGVIDHLHVKAAAIGMNVVGGLIFGVGMAVLGYCPGTAVAAIGQGSRDAAVGTAGMIVGAAVYAEAYPWIARVLEPIGKLTTARDLQTLPGLTGLSPWWFIAGLAAVAVGVFIAVSRRPAAGPAERAGESGPPAAAC